MAKAFIEQLGKEKGVSTPLTQRAELFRSKLIHQFQLVEVLGDAARDFDSSRQPPYLFTDSVTDDEKAKRLLANEPNSLIKFKVFSKQVSVKSSYLTFSLLKTLTLTNKHRSNLTN
jgi:hypothetical protein